MEGFTSEGIWWVPGNDENYAAGILRFEPYGEARLDLIGSVFGTEPLVRLSADPAELTEDDHAALTELAARAAEQVAATEEADEDLGDGWVEFPAQLPILHGVITGAEVTLYGLLETRRDDASMPGVARHSFAVRHIVRGAHLGDIDDVRYTVASIQLERLTEWCGASLRRPSVSVSATADDADADAAAEEPLRCQLATGEEVVLTLGRRRHSSAHEHREWMEPRFIVRLPEPRLLPELLSEYVRPLQDFITVTSGWPSALVQLIVTTPGARWGDHDQLLTVDTAHSRPKPQPGASHASQMLLPLEVLDFSETVPSWFDVHREHAVAAQFCFANRYDEVPYGENRILTATTAAEALHASIKPESRTPFLLKAAAVQLILDQFPADEHDLLRARLEHFNKPSLRQRLKDLLADAGPAMGTLAPRGWVSLVVWARNQVAHGADDRPNGPQLRALAEAVGHLVEVRLLMEAGLPAERIAERLPRSPRYRWVEELRSTYLDELFS